MARIRERSPTILNDQAFLGLRGIRQIRDLHAIEHYKAPASTTQFRINDMRPGPIVTRCDYDVSASTLWEAITHPVHMRKWFFESMHSFIPEPGFTTRFSAQYDEKMYVHIWRVREVVPEEKISFLWEYGNYTGSSLVSFELYPENGRTFLRVTHFGSESFRRQNPDFPRASCSERWDFFICRRLKSYLNGGNLRVL